MTPNYSKIAEDILEKGANGFSFGKAEKEHAKGDWDFNQLRFWFLDVLTAALLQAHKEGEAKGAERVVRAVEAVEDRWAKPEHNELGLRKIEGYKEGRNACLTAACSALASIKGEGEKKCRFDDCKKLEKDCLETCHRE